MWNYVHKARKCDIGLHTHKYPQTPMRAGAPTLPSIKRDRVKRRPHPSSDQLNKAGKHYFEFWLLMCLPHDLYWLKALQRISCSLAILTYRYLHRRAPLRAKDLQHCSRFETMASLIGLFVFRASLSAVEKQAFYFYPFLEKRTWRVQPLLAPLRYLISFYS